MPYPSTPRIISYGPHRSVSNPHVPPHTPHCISAIALYRSDPALYWNLPPRYDLSAVFFSVPLVPASTRIPWGVLLYIIMPGCPDAHAVRGGEAGFCIVLCRVQLYM